MLMLLNTLKISTEHVGISPNSRIGNERNMWASKKCNSLQITAKYFHESSQCQQASKHMQRQEKYCRGVPRLVSVWRLSMLTISCRTLGSLSKAGSFRRLNRSTVEHLGSAINFLTTQPPTCPDPPRTAAEKVAMVTLKTSKLVRKVCIEQCWINGWIMRTLREYLIFLCA